MEYMFVADTSGLTSLLPVDPSTFKQVTMYCQFNLQRRCVWGTIELDEDVAEGLQYMMNDGMPDVALNLIKQSKFALPISNMSKYSRLLETIPDLKLDPMAV